MTDTKWKITPGEWEGFREELGAGYYADGIRSSNGTVVISAGFVGGSVTAKPVDKLAFSRVPKMLDLLHLVSGVLDQDHPMGIKARALLKGLHEDYE